MNLSFRSKLLLSHGFVVLAAATVAALVVRSAVRSRMQSQVDRRLLNQANAVAKWLERAGHPERLSPRLAGVVGARVTIVGRDGAVYGDSVEAPFQEPGLSSAPEIVAALRGEVGRATRYSRAVGERVRYVAVAAPRDLVVRIGLPIGEVDDTADGIIRQLGVGALISLVVAAALAMLLAAALTRRLREASAMARRVATGDYEVEEHERPPETDEVGVVARTLADAAIALHATDERRREFLANVAHELRTPVTSISGFAQTLSDTDVDPETRAEFLATIDRNARRIAKLVDDLLELEAFAHGRGPEMAREEVDVASVLTHVEQTMAALVRDGEAELSVEVGDGVRARGDEGAIERIVLNLVDNSLRHGGDGVRVEVSARVDSGRVVVRVSDSGPGISDEDRKRVFERFRHSGPRSGGLGLAIARELARAMDGELRLEPPGESGGAVFALDLPAV